MPGTIKLKRGESRHNKIPNHLIDPGTECIDSSPERESRRAHFSTELGKAKICLFSSSPDTSIITKLNCTMAKIWLTHEEFYEENLPMILENTRPLHIQLQNFVILLGSSECRMANLSDYGNLPSRCLPPIR